MLSPIRQENISPSTYSKNDDNILCQKIPSISEYVEETSNIVICEKTFDTDTNQMFKRFSKLNTIKEVYEDKITFDQMSIRDSTNIKLKSEFLLNYKSFDKDKSLELIEEYKEEERDRTPV